MRSSRRLVLCTLALGCASPVAAPLPQADEEAPVAAIRFGDPEAVGYDAEFFPGTEYDPAVPAPETVLGQRHGTRLSHHEEILACFRSWAEASARLSVERFGATHEGRELVLAVVTSPSNHARLDEILGDLDRLHDPRGLTEEEGERIARETPAVAWMGYSIHGDEVSGADASVAVGHHLVASQDEDVARLLERVVVVIDPVMNPDGRQRIIGMVEQSAGVTPNLDYASMQRGRWPYGRGNHYLFDMNRDWMAGTQPETRARWRAALRFHPQLFVDAHEMGSLDTYLFYPQAEPLNPSLPASLNERHRLFAAGAAAAFDRRGWAYYTREWADGWGPFYSDAWGSLTGATGILYEQAGTSGFALRRASGEILTYRESVHHQAVASLANIRTLAEHREELLADYLATKRRWVAEGAAGGERTFVVLPGRHPERVRRLASTLAGQGIEIFIATETLVGTEARGHLGAEAAELELPPGTLLVPGRQPMAGLVGAYLGLDPRMERDALEEERADLEHGEPTNIYDLSSWALPYAFDVDAWWCRLPDGDQGGGRGPWPADAPAPDPEPDPDAYAWIVDGENDASLRFAAAALERELTVHVSDEPFRSGGRPFARGSLAVRRDENRRHEDLAGRLAACVRAAGVELFAAETGLSADEGPDLGGGHFHALVRPRVAILGNAPVATDTYGHLWHELDREIGVPSTILDAQLLGRADLRRYNVIVLPPTWAGIERVLEPVQERLVSWIEAGGTLVACADSAAALTAGELGVSQVTLRRHALDDLALYQKAAERERERREIEVDEERLWDGATGEGESSDREQPEDEVGSDPEEIDEEEDAWLRRFSPQGVTLLSMVDERHWITAGSGPEMPVPFDGGRVFLSRDPVRTPLRLVPAERLRLGGLLWPEARERVAGSAWLTVERVGNGQVILFAFPPAFRGYSRATARLFGNAVVYGPGLGTNQPVGW